MARFARNLVKAVCLALAVIPEVRVFATERPPILVVDPNQIPTDLAALFEETFFRYRRDPEQLREVAASQKWAELNRV